MGRLMSSNCFLAVRPILLLIIISDWSLPHFPLIKYGFLISAAFCLQKILSIFPVILVVSAIGAVPFVGFLLSNQSVAEPPPYIFFLSASILQAFAILRIALDPIKLGPLSLPKPASVIDLLLLFLVLIGFFQYAFGSERPQFVFFETNYIGLWLPLLLSVRFISRHFPHYLLTTPSSIAKLVAHNSSSIVFICIVVLFALSKSLTTFFVVGTFFSSVWLLSFLRFLLRTLYKLRFSTSYTKLLFGVMASSCSAAILLPYLHPLYNDLLVGRIIKLISNPDTYYSISGLRAITFDAAFNLYLSSPLNVQLFGGFSAVRHQTIVGPSGSLVQIPLSGIFSLLLQYGAVGSVVFLVVQVVSIYRLILILSITNRLASFSLLFPYLVSTYLYLVLISTNLTYACVGTFLPCLTWVLRENFRATRFLATADKGPSFS